tara:strand:+ start:1434 stop:2567 length:1134 start_codon:yes stop_codon:yes gene_type:complete
LKIDKMIRKNIRLAEPLIKQKDTIKILKTVLKSNYVNEGKLTRVFEKKISKLLNVKYVLTCTSGTIAIFLSLKAIGVKSKDEVLIPNLTFPATANAVSLTGAKPILVDINKKNLLFDLKELNKKINKKTKAIIPVHISGRGSNIKEVLKLAKLKKIHVIEDAAEAFMSKLNGKYYGTFGSVGCFSFAPNKIFTTGQGGIVVTNDKKIFKELSKLKDQGRIGPTTGGEDNYEKVGYNFKFTNLQSALGLSQLKDIRWRVSRLKDHYKYYIKNIKTSENFRFINFNLKKGEVPLWTDIFCKKRNKLFNFLKAKNIECRYFWKPINCCKPYKKSFRNLENSKELSGKLMWLPSSLSLKDKDLKKICNLINKFNEKNFNNG